MESPEKWDNLVKSQHGHPLQLFGWGEVKKSTNSWQVAHAVRANPKDASADFAQILIRQTPLGRFGYIPRGPNLTDEFLQELRVVAKRKNLFMLRFEPNVAQDNWHIWRTKLKTPRDHILLSKTVQLDLTKSADTLLAEMDSTTRQNIRRGERNSALQIRPATAADLPRILEIYHQTATRSNFPLHPDTYYQSIFQNMAAANHLFVALVDNTIEAFVWCIKTPAACFELYGGATSLGLKHRANYLLKWQAILAAQATSKIYDLNGLLNDGISDFKRGFSAHVDGHSTETLLAPTSDLVLKPFRYFLFSTLLPLAKRLFKARRT
ncbi:peptidoglycan bridge formation glycyltransferase FemA/FemB family protein [Candidatus Saccharibacteria bacterium]|nr:peptidoglycan bridge formation glycyltransferase FemA/FemB family protein [Candidatus Saccharibacteria bacterium]